MVDLKIKLPEHFLDEEVRCNYLVTHEMKEVWAVELDLLAELLRVCKKYNITIFASGGTMLGAVRHKGFIPWDDDIDMMMFRGDYEKLCEVAPLEFNHPYFFQTEYTDRGSLRGHAQLRNSKTTGILKGELENKFPFNQGIFIDIFPLDSVVDDVSMFNRQKKLALKYRKLAFFFASVSTRFSKNRNFIKNIIKKILHLVGNNFFEIMSKKYYIKFELACQRYNTESNTNYISSLSFMFDNKQHFKYRSDYQAFIELDFEFLKIPVGKEFEHALTRRYGNYKKFERGTSCHGGVIFDVNKSYNEYFKEVNNE